MSTSTRHTTRDRAARKLDALGLPISKTYIDQMEHQLLCEKAAALGIPTSLDDPASPKTISELYDAIAAHA